MKSLNISAVSYLNTYPFVYGILNSGCIKSFSLDLAVPSVCADHLAQGNADIALIPVGAIPQLPPVQFVTNFCIGAVRQVRTVLLLSHKPLKEIGQIYLDWDSRTSVQLVKVLAKNFWKIDPKWKNFEKGESDQADGIESLVAIGDKTFGLAQRYEYIYDLAEEWIRFTSLPFVFAVWVTTKELPERIIQDFNDALTWGVDHKPETLAFFKDKIPPGIDAFRYLNENISFEFDNSKRKGLELFLSYLTEH